MATVVIVGVVCVATSRAISSEPDYASGLKPYVAYRHSALMHNVRVNLPGSTLAPPSKYLRITELQLKNISPEDAAKIIEKTCSEQIGWSLRTRRTNAFFRKGEISIAVVARPHDVGPDSNVQDPSVTAMVMEDVPVPKNKEAWISLLGRFGIRLAR